MLLFQVGKSSFDQRRTGTQSAAIVSTVVRSYSQSETIDCAGCIRFTQRSQLWRSGASGYLSWRIYDRTASDCLEDL